MHCAIAEVGTLYATATVHEGWDAVKADGFIRFSDRNSGGHAYAIVAYDDQVFWIQGYAAISWIRFFI